MIAPTGIIRLGVVTIGILWAVNPKAEPVEIGSHSTPKVPSRRLLTVPDDATRAVK